MFFSKKVEKPPEYEIYSSCSDLPFYNWVKLNTTKDLKWLIKKGLPQQQDLEVAWSEIYQEYIGLVDGAEAQHIINLKRDIDVAEKRITLTLDIVNRLKEKRSDKGIEVLKVDLGFMMSYDDLDKDLSRTLRLLNTEQVKLKVNKARYKEFTADGSAEASEKDFNEQLAVLAKFQGVAIIKQKEISVQEYVTLLNLYKEHVKPQRNAK